MCLRPEDDGPTEKSLNAAAAVRPGGAAADGEKNKKMDEISKNLSGFPFHNTTNQMLC